MPGLPRVFRVLLLSHDAAMAVQLLPKTLPSRFLFMLHDHLSDRRTQLKQLFSVPNQSLLK